MERHSKLKVLEIIGFIHQKFDGQKFERSYPLIFRSIIVYLLIVTTLVKYPLCLLFDKNDVVQLFIGSFWNYLNQESRLWMGIVVCSVKTQKLNS